MTDDPNPYAPPPVGAAASADPQYAAQPEYAAPTQYAAAPGQLGSWGRRVGGRLIDAVIVIIPAAVIGGVTHSRAAYDIVAVVLGLVIGYLNGAQGQSPGKRAVGLRLVRDSDGQLIGGGMGIVREIAHILDSLALLLGWLWPLWDSKKQTFADKVCGTVVVRV